uniref:Uncharacterized protein n=1 Tax=Cucumis melo TaxID=3656 RepID=A0A9I9E4Z9_CUCME
MYFGIFHLPGTVFSISPLPPVFSIIFSIVLPHFPSSVSFNLKCFFSCCLLSIFYFVCVPSSPFTIYVCYYNSTMIQASLYIVY